MMAGKMALWGINSKIRGCSSQYRAIAIHRDVTRSGKEKAEVGVPKQAAHKQGPSPSTSLEAGSISLPASLTSGDGAACGQVPVSHYTLPHKCGVKSPLSLT